MKRFLLALVLLFISSGGASAQCNGVFSPNTVCGSIAGGIPGQVATTAILPSPGIPTNVRSAYTGTASMATTDCGKTVALGGSAFYNFTINAASTYNAACEVIITNEDSNCPANGAATCRGKAISINGYSAFILWPGQTFNLLNQNNVWQYNQPGRWVVQALPLFNINHASGGNPFAATPATDCLGSGAGACNTIQNCILIIEGMIDNNGFGPTCKNVAETFTENNAQHTHPIIGYHVISITGDTTTPANVVWQVSGSGNAAYVGRDTGMAILQGFKFVSTGTGNVFIQAGQSGIADFGSMEFGSNTSGVDIQITPAGAANWFGGALTISGNMSAFVQMPGEGHVLLDGATISMPNVLTFFAFFQLNGPANVSATSMTFTGAGSGAASTGAQWLIDRYTNLNIATSVIPGASKGLYNCQPIISVFTSGTDATFTPSSCNGLFPLVLEIELVGGGGGGAGSGTTPGAGGNGGATCWKASGTACTSPLFQSAGGTGGAAGAGTGATAAGGAASNCDSNLTGGSGGPGENIASRAGGAGGVSALGGNAPAGILLNVAGTAAAANSGSGGSGGSAGGTLGSGGGGGAGAYCYRMLTNPAPSSAVYTVGAAGTAGTLGTSGSAGGAGAAGRVKVIQRW